jgi:hypothetical protein
MLLVLAVDWIHFFHIFFSPTCQWVTWTSQSTTDTQLYVESVYHSGFVLYLRCHHERLFKLLFVSVSRCFPKVKMKFYANSLFLQVHRFTGLQCFRVHSAQTHGSIICAKMQRSVAATPIVLIHNKSTVWHQAAHSCIVPS